MTNLLTKFILKHTRLCSGLSPGSSRKNTFLCGSVDHIQCQKLNLGQPCKRQVPYRLYYLSSLNVGKFINIILLAIEVI